ncbi:MAG: 50S ribosomal protein L10 [Patescibacteria group bacterium]|nr:50S ribosomal protein L10 [Patescibacteria group bacterium]
MPKTKEQKQNTLKELKQNIEKQKSIIFADFTGLKVNDLTDLRKQMREKDCELKVAKKTLIRMAFENFNLEVGKKIKDFKGEIILGFGYKDEVSAFKVLGDFSGDNKNLKILGGVMENEFLDANNAIAMSKLPSKQELLARLVGSVKAPVSNFVGVLEGNIKSLVYILSKVKV